MRRRLTSIFLLIILAACVTPFSQPVESVISGDGQTVTPFQPITKTPLPGMTLREITPTLTLRRILPGDEILITMEDYVPQALVGAIQLPSGVRKSGSEQDSRLRLTVGGEFGVPIRWVYALVAPFPTLVDQVTFAEIQAAWQGAGSHSFGGAPLMVSRETLAAFAALWGKPADNGVAMYEDDASLLQEAWTRRPAWALVPFEALEPRWKVIQVDGLSPIQKNLDLNLYPLVVNFGWHGDAEVWQIFQEKVAESSLLLPAGNRDENKMTTLIMTGVTALVRATAYRMEIKGVNYPARDIRDWLLSADLTHISNEVPFTANCPYPDPLDESLSFCSHPKYIELLEFVEADIIELTGNHLNDKGSDAMLSTLDLYRQHGLPYYAAGEDYATAITPLKIVHNGNKLAFLGCNWWGPKSVWATDNRPGVAPCYYADLDAILGELRQEGYLPIFTFQYLELYHPQATAPQKADFRGRAEAGAVIVSGSQAHRPQAMEFWEGSFIHYGLGNLFFDQSEELTGPGTQDVFLDWHVFYHGKYISTGLLTAWLEDFARPRPMTGNERSRFLTEIFAASGW